MKVIKFTKNIVKYKLVVLKFHCIIYNIQVKKLYLEDLYF